MMSRKSGFCVLSSIVCIIAVCIAAMASAAEEPARATRQSTATATLRATPAQPARAKKVNVAPGDPRYKCEDDECECSGVLDCRNLLDSGSCDGKDFWEDGDDPSKGGCG
jgi:hypothetical protein